MMLSLKRRLGFKDRILFRCRGEHDWREAFGDERMFYKRWQCRTCPIASD